MTDKEKIRNEVEKCYSKALERAKITDVDYWGHKAADAYCNVLIQLDSLQEEPISEELEEAAKEYSFHRTYSGDMEYYAENEIDAFKAGAKWQKEQMMSKTVKGTARPDDGEIWCDLKPFNFKDGDKVKVIVI